MRDIIIDAETLDTKDTAVIPSIGARLCNLETGEMGEGFHVKLNVQEQIDAGYTISASTLAFWMNQQQAARSYLIDIMDRKVPLVSRQVGFSMLHQFISSVKNANVWGNGISFDLGLCIREWGPDNLPWEFWNEQDVRSIVSFGRRVFGVQFKKEVQFEGTQHNPLDDATHEAQYLMEYFKHGRELSDKSIVLTQKLFTAETELQQAQDDKAQRNIEYLEDVAKEQREISELRQALDKAHARILELESPVALNPLDELTALDQEVAAECRDDGVKLEGMTEDPAPAQGDVVKYHSVHFHFAEGSEIAETLEDFADTFVEQSKIFSELAAPEDADVIYTSSECEFEVFEGQTVIFVDRPRPECKNADSDLNDWDLWDEWHQYSWDGQPAKPAPTQGEMERIYVMVHGGNERFLSLLRHGHNIAGAHSLSELPVPIEQVAATIYPKSEGITKEKKEASKERGIPVIGLTLSDFEHSTDPQYGTTLRRRIAEAGKGPKK